MVPWPEVSDLRTDLKKYIPYIECKEFISSRCSLCRLTNKLYFHAKLQVQVQGFATRPCYSPCVVT
jgi:hypothetical protein